MKCKFFLSLNLLVNRRKSTLWWVLIYWLDKGTALKWILIAVFRFRNHSYLADITWFIWALIQTLIIDLNTIDLILDRFLRDHFVNDTVLLLLYLNWIGVCSQFLQTWKGRFCHYHRWLSLNILRYRFYSPKSTNLDRFTGLIPIMADRTALWSAQRSKVSCVSDWSYLLINFAKFMLELFRNLAQLCSLLRNYLIVPSHLSLVCFLCFGEALEWTEIVNCWLLGLFVFPLVILISVEYIINYDTRRKFQMLLELSHWQFRAHRPRVLGHKVHGHHQTT